MTELYRWLLAVLMIGACGPVSVGHGAAPDGSTGPDSAPSCGADGCIDSDSCEHAAARGSYLGCEYWAVDLDNAIAVLGQSWGGTDCRDYEAGAIAITTGVCYAPFAGVHGLCDEGGDCSAAGAGASCMQLGVCVLDAQHAPFAIVVANPNLSSSVAVTLADASGRQTMATLGPGQVLPLFPQRLGFDDQSLSGSGIAPRAYRVTSSLPIAAYQFNPLDNVGVFSNDASLLIPSAAYGTRYYGVSYPTQHNRPNDQDSRGFITVVASHPGTTSVMVTPTAPVVAGPRVARLLPGQSASFSLTQFDTLNLEAADGDLTGTSISSDQPVGVFGGHQAAAISQDATPRCYADHLEEQILPASTWGKLYAVARSQSRRNEPDRLRILAQRPATSIVFDPAVASCPLLGPGEHCDVVVPSDVSVAASEPILVAHYLLSVGVCGFELKPPGDPSLSLAVPREQFRRSYVFLTPSQYSEDYASIVVPAGGSALVDGMSVTSALRPFGAGSFLGGRVALGAGRHQLECSSGCGLEVYGYDATVSYMFPGGLDLASIVVP